MTEHGILHTNVLIKLRPVNSFAIPDKAPILAFGGCAIQKSRVPGKRHGKGAAVAQSQDQLILCDRNTMYNYGLQISR